MFRPGLVSITFRQLSPEEIIRLVRIGGLQAIEWGGDVHCPHGDVNKCREVGEMTRDYRLEVAAYGSYYRCGVSEEQGLSFADVLASAKALEAPLIRVWAGQRATENADEAYIQAVVDDSLRIAEMAAAEGIEVAFEFHSNTLTDSGPGAEGFLAKTSHPNLSSLWQPINGATPEVCLDALDRVLPRFSNLHVFSWGAGFKEKYPLADGADRWARYLKRAATAGPRADGKPRYALMEFVKDDEPDQFLEDAKTLLTWLESV